VPHFQEYDVARLNLKRDANLVIQRTLELGTWDELAWLFETYGMTRIRQYVREGGERGLERVTFNYWRRLLGIHRWKKSPFRHPQGALWLR
jgi:hypothetical protein